VSRFKRVPAFSAYLFAKGRTWPAIQELELAFSLEPTADNALAHLRGLCRNKDFLEALEQAEAYLIRFPESLHLREQKAVILDRLGRNQEAAFVYRSLLEGVYKGRFLKLANRNYAVKYCTRIARLYAKDKRYEEAVAVLKWGTGRHPREARLYYFLGIYLRQLNRREQTLTALKKAVFLDTSNVHYRYQLGEEYRRAGLYQNAAEEWKKCLEVKPGFAQCKAAINRIEKELGLDSDLISYEKGLVFEFSNKEDAVKYSIHIAQLYAKDERYADAEAVLRRRIEKYPEEGRLYYPLGLYLHHLNRGRQALAALKKAVFFEYDNAEYRYRLGEEYRSGGLYRRAEEEWNICLEIAPDSAQCREAIIGVKDKIGLNGENEE
jgi:tetratricopeptide (TPR) repeat protein